MLLLVYHQHAEETRCQLTSILATEEELVKIVDLLKARGVGVCLHMHRFFVRHWFTQVIVVIKFASTCPHPRTHARVRGFWC